jgi:hypothetical protein
MGDRVEPVSVPVKWRGMIDMLKGCLCDRGESGSERRARPQRRVVNELARSLSLSLSLSLCVCVCEGERDSHKDKSWRQ